MTKCVLSHMLIMFNCFAKYGVLIAAGSLHENCNENTAVKEL